MNITEVQMNSKKKKKWKTKQNKNTQIVQRGNIYSPDTQIHVCSLSCPGGAAQCNDF